MKVPQSLNEITIEQFQFCYAILRKDNSVHGWILVLSYLTGKEVDYFEEMPVKDVLELAKKLQFIKDYQKGLIINDTIYIGSKKFKGLTDISKGTFSQFTSIKTVASKGDVIENIHFILGSIYCEAHLFGNKYNQLEASESLKQAKAGDVLGLVFFYSKILKHLNPIILKSLEEVKNHAQILAQEKNSLKHTVGI